jgi:thiol-disulfide isomerase/thioredoxin
MHAISIGPLVLAGGHLAVIVGIGVFLIVTTALGRRIDPRLGHWTNTALIIGLIMARLGHVVEHGASFAAAPWRIFALWQGGFSLWWGVVGGLIAGAFSIRKWQSGLWAIVALGFSLWAWSVVGRMTAGTMETTVPSGTFERLDGRRMMLAEITGKPAIINLWASWCPPCRREMPTLMQASAQHHEVRFLFVNQGESPEKINAYLSKETLDPSNVFLDPFGDMARHYNMPGLPATLFIDSDGRLRSAHIGQISPEELEDEIAKMKQAEGTDALAK